MADPVQEPPTAPTIPATSFPLLVLLLVAPPVLVFALVGPRWGMLVGLVTAGVLAVAAARRPHTEPIEVADAAGERERLLVVLLGPVPERALADWRERVLERRRIEGAATPGEALVLAPAVGSRLRRWLSTKDPARQQAEERLERSLSLLRSSGLQVRGQLGDPNAVLAVEDALRQFPAGRVVLVGDGDASAVADELAPRLSQPVEVVGATT
ncbi:MAG TPA: hypothetical protein VHF58_05995 [Solirubrobacterales bacterium]|nr:hypothetical protein [Solirubrobacterales bacterium]